MRFPIMYRHGDQTRDRMWAVAGVVAVHGMLAYALLSGLAMRVSERASESLKLVDIALPEPPPPPPPPPEESSKPKGEPSPPNLKAVPTPVVAPPRRIPAPSPVAAVPVPSTGAAPSAGASNITGPGTGAGGAGSGLGGGGAGSGGGARRAQWIAGGVSNGDYRRIAGGRIPIGTADLVLRINSDGRPGSCRTAKSSGDPGVDSALCGLLIRRLRFRPATNAAGERIAQDIVYTANWRR